MTWKYLKQQKQQLCVCVCVCVCMCMRVCGVTAAVISEQFFGGLHSVVVMNFHNFHIKVFAV
jgi:hypothetical protein